MHRVLACVALAFFPPDLAAQGFQFMPLTPGATPPSMVPLQQGVRSWIAGDDFDSNGYCDLLFTSDFGVQLFQGSATGWSAGQQLVWGWQQPRLVDLDGDGDRDLAFVPPALTTPRTVLLFRNTPSGMSYVALPSQMNALVVQGIALGDVDGNGVADMIVAATVGSATPSLMIARGAPGVPGLVYTLDLVSMPAGLPYGLWPELFDADGDGDLDVLATNATSGLLLLTNVGGSFVDGTASLPTARTGHVRLVAADFDGDGRSDVAAVHETFGDLDLLWGGASGLTFVATVATLTSLRDLEPADFDGDGDLDLLADHNGGHDVLWNQGSRQFVRNFAVGSTWARGVADVDRDGEADLLYVPATNNRLVRCRFGARIEAGTSGTEVSPASGHQIAAPLPADVDGDGRTDVVFLQRQQTTIERALGGGLYQRSIQPPVSQSWFVGGAQAADIDQDGDVDIVVHDSLQVAIADNDGTGTLAWTTLGPSTTSTYDHLRLHDVDGDGDLDILHADPAGAMWIRNLGGGQYAPSAAIGGPTPAHCVEIADVDGDGDGDAIVTSGPTSAILANDGAGLFAPNPAFLLQAGSNPSSLRAGDFDGDGDQDLAVVDTSLRLHRNNGAGAFTETTATDLPPSATATSNLVAADLDADGDLDLAVTVAAPVPLQLFVNDGTGRFSNGSAARVQPVTLLPNTHQLRAVDYDDDGDIDLLAASAGSQFVLVNHLQQCRTSVAPRLGATAAFQLFSWLPGSGQPGLGLLGVGFAPAAPPLRLPGVTGQLELDLTLLQIVASFTTSPGGVSSALVGVPPDPVLFGLEVWFQGALLPGVGNPAFTNAVAEVVSR